MPVPALLYGLLSDHGIWYPVNLLAGMVLPGIGTMTETQLEEFSLPLAAHGHCHPCGHGRGPRPIYGVLLPTLPDIPSPVAWGGLLMPLLWTDVSFSLMGVIDPVLRRGVNWPWFIISQFVFGVVAAVVVDRSEEIPVPAAGHG